METIVLLGYEEVRSAGNRMWEAAHMMNQAATSIDNSLSNQRIFMDEWMSRLESAIAGKS